MEKKENGEWEESETKESFCNSRKKIEGIKWEERIGRVGEGRWGNNVNSKRR